MKKIVSAALAAVIAISVAGSSISAEICGKTYPIAEPDLLVEAHAKAEKLMHNKAYLSQLREKLKYKTLHYVSPRVEYLPPSKKSFSYKYDVVYTLPFDIPRVDKNGKVIGILYPKGFTFHVMRYIPYMPTLVVFDIKNPLEREWVEKKYKDNYEVMLLSVSGDAQDLINMAKKMKRPIYFDLKGLDKRLNIRYTVSIVSKDKFDPDLVDIKVVGLEEIKKDISKIKKRGKHAEKATSNKKH